RPRQHDDGVVVDFCAVHPGGRIAAELGPRDDPAQHQRRGQEARGNEKGETTVWTSRDHHQSVPKHRTQVARTTGSAVALRASKSTPPMTRTVILVGAASCLMLLGSSLLAQARPEPTSSTTATVAGPSVTVTPSRPATGSFVVLSIRRANREGDS